MAARAKRYPNHISARVGDEHVAVLNGIRDNLEAELPDGKRLQYGDVLRYILELPNIRKRAQPKEA